MRYVIYCRVSTERQADEGVSLATQEEALRGWCALYRHDVVDVIVESGSGSSLERPGLQRALGMLVGGAADGLLVHRLDRLTRNMGDLHTLYTGPFKERALASMTEHLDTSTATGRMMLNLLGTFAQFQRESMLERVGEAFAHARRQGRITSRDAPFGWRADTEGVLEPEPLEQAALDFIEARRDEGGIVRAMAEARLEGYRGRRGGLSRSTVSAALGRGRDAAGRWRPFDVEV
jgi:DNA invertase Pin-like site-specific DNA recombinase